MSTGTCPWLDFTPEQLRFPPAGGFTIRADFTGEMGSSDLGTLVLSVVDQLIGLIDRLVQAVADSCGPRYITHPLGIC